MSAPPGRLEGFPRWTLRRDRRLHRTTGNYQITQRCAEGFGPDGAGFLGVRYQPRFSTDSTTWALGLFGDAGERGDWTTDPSPRSGLAIAADLGIPVARPPTVAELTADGMLRDQVQ